MARIRSIKHDLFLDEVLGALSGEHFKLYVGLKTLADREGRVEDRPVRIKASLFPYRAVDVDALIHDLHESGLVSRYEVAGVRCVAISDFLRQDRPHPKEPASELPAPPTGAETASREKKRQATEGHSSIPSSPGVVVVDAGVVVDPVVEVDLAARAGPPTPPPPPGTWVRTLLPGKLDPPAAPVEAWSAWDFWVWTQVMREGVQLVREKPPPDRVLGDWWADVKGSGVATPRLKQAFREFAKDPRWESALPPLPFRAFISQWRNYVPQEPPRAASR